MFYTYNILMFFVILASVVFSNDDKKFSIKSKETNYIKLNYNSTLNNTEQKPELIKYINENIVLDEKLHLPSSTTLYQVKDGYDIDVDFEVNDISQIALDDLIGELHLNLENYNGVYPESNLVVSEALIFRGVVVKEITYIPYRIDFDNNIVEFHNNIDINIENIVSSSIRDYSNVKLSKAFEPLYEDMIINYEPSSREEDYQTPSVLYICGGSSISNPFLEQLIEWRHKTGFVVAAVSVDEIGGSSSSTIKNYIQNAYQTWENPPEYVGLIGDTNGSYSIGYFTENVSGYNGEGDFPYTQLDGEDFLPEVYLGRLSVSNSSELSNVINKALVYERATYLSNDSSWYERAALCGDPSSSGNSTVITNEYIGNILNAYDFEDVNGNYGNGNYASWMENELEDGCLYMNYRGYYGVSGFGASNINNANNSYKTPFAVFITCGTGGFSGTALSEELYRAGSVSNPKGAVGAIGTATTGTHTLFNNIVNMGIYDGIFPKGINSAGGALASGRLSLYWTYPDNPGNCVTIFSHWTNLMGDPALRLWTDTPKVMNVSFNDVVSFGTNFIDVQVQDLNGNNLENANVTVLKGNDEIFKTVQTNDEGIATIPIEYDSEGEVYLTVIKDNYKPVESSFDIILEQVTVNVDHDEIIVLDDPGANGTEGNGDGILNPGEIAIIQIPVINLGLTTASNIQGILTSGNDLINVISGINQYGSIAPSNSSTGTTFYLVSVDDNFTNDSEYELRIQISDDSNHDWESIININVQAGLLAFDHVELVNNIELNPGETSELRVFIENKGEVAINDVSLQLTPSSYLIDVIQGELEFGTIQPNQIIGSQNTAAIFVNGDAINGSIANLSANVLSSNGYNQSISVNLNIGHTTQEDPLGPDEYGYYIYDSSDLGYSLAPIYDWIEIDNDYFGSGTNLNLNDGGDGNNINNSSEVVDLPFPFTFYGETYNQITINSNGWISFGESILESFRNYTIPGAGGPSPMLAAFWDDLKTTGSAEVYYYEGENFVIIEWSEMRTNQNNSIETFQIILYDDTYLTPTGDNEIKIQYKEFNNTTSGSYSGWGALHGCYSTVGIENHLATIGLEYTFDNEYPIAAMPLENETALFITTRSPIATLYGDANFDSGVDILDIVLVMNHILVVELLNPLGVYVSDMDGDGDITILDIIRIVNVILDTL